MLQEKAADAAVESALGSYKDQLGYGFHIIVVMGVFYLIGHLAASTISHKLSVVSYDLIPPSPYQNQPDHISA